MEVIDFIYNFICNHSIVVAIYYTPYEWIHVKSPVGLQFDQKFQALFIKDISKYIIKVSYERGYITYAVLIQPIVHWLAYNRDITLPKVSKNEVRKDFLEFFSSEDIEKISWFRFKVKFFSDEVAQEAIAEYCTNYSYLSCNYKHFNYTDGVVDIDILHIYGVLMKPECKK